MDQRSGRPKPRLEVEQCVTNALSSLAAAANADPLGVGGDLLPDCWITVQCDPSAWRHVAFFRDSYPVACIRGTRAWID